MDGTDQVRELREVEGFDRVRLRDFGELVIRQGERESLTVQADRELLAKVRTTVRNGELLLEVGTDLLDRILTGIRTLWRQPLRYELTVRELRSVGISGRATLHLEGLRTPQLELTVNGAASVRVERLEAERLVLNVSGRTDVAVAGAATRQEWNVSGSADISAAEFESAEARVRISGQCNAELAVREQLDVSISGMGRLRYHGDPQVRQQVSGSGTIERVA